MIHLGQHQSAAVMGGSGHLVLLQQEGLLFHADVPIGIGGAALDDADIQRERREKELLLPGQLHQLHHFLAAFPGLLVHAAAIPPRVHKGPEPHRGQYPRLFPGDGPHHVGHDPLRSHKQRKIPCADVGVNGIGQAEIAAQKPGEHPPVRKMIDAPAAAIAAQARHIHQPQVTGVALPQEALLHLTQDILRQRKADKAIHRHRHAVTDQGGGLGGRDHLCHALSSLIPR